MADYGVINPTILHRWRFSSEKGDYGTLIPGTILNSEEIVGDWLILDYDPLSSDNKPPYAVALEDLSVHTTSSNPDWIILTNPEGQSDYYDKRVG